MKTHAEIEAAIAAQRELWERAGLPELAPADGVCFSCHEQIYTDEHLDGTSLVTGCPHCNRSYAD